MDLNRGGFVLAYSFRGYSVGSSRPIALVVVETQHVVLGVRMVEEDHSIHSWNRERKNRPMS